jgi:NADPH:quinone reductase-like Zn-dependent oxidoreductase
MMKVAQLNSFGHPPEVVECIDVDAPGAPGADEVIVDIEAGPINPAEILLIQGKYASKPPLPARLGIEGVGRVSTIGSDIGDLRPGDRVMSLDRSNWAEKKLLKRNQLIRLPNGIDVLQASMLKVNPATALMMLDDYVELKAGDWVIQNAANSGVGTAVIALAKARGVHTINVVRRESLKQPLQALGADLVVLEGDDLGARVRAEIGSDAGVRLAIDAVAGRACLHLADCLSDEGTVVNYGLLSGDPCMITAEQTVFRGISLTGFWLAKVLGSMQPQAMQTLYDKLARYVVDGTLHINVEATYSLGDIRQALAHAMREGRDGKILVTPDH